MAECDLLSRPFVLTGTVPAHRFVTRDGALPTSAGAAVLAVARQAGEAGDAITVGMRGVFEVETGGTIALGQTVGTDASGRAVGWTTGYKLGVALTASTGAGQRAEVLLLHTPH